MVKPEKFGYLHLVYLFTVPLSFCQNGSINISVGDRFKYTRKFKLRSKKTTECMKSEAIADATKIPLWNVFNACAIFNVNIFIMFDDNIINTFNIFAFLIP